METFQDLKGGLRGVFRNPGVSGVVILTLAVSIGAGTSIFSVVNGVLFSALPVPDQDRLLRVSTRFLPESGYDYEYFTLTLREYFDYAEQNSTLSDLFTLSGGRRILTSEGGEATMIRVMSTTPGMYDAFGVPPLLGRTLTAEDELTDDAIVLSHAMWTNLGNDPDILGRSLVIDERPYEIVGVMPQGFGFPDLGVMAWRSRVLPSEADGHFLAVWARMKDGVSIEDVRAELDVLVTSWRRDSPDHFNGHHLVVEPLIDDYVGRVKATMFVLLGAVGLLLLIACVNVASVLLARGEIRRQEFAVRHALGAGKQRLFRQLLVEYSVLAVVGGGLGVGLAFLGVPALMGIEGNGIPRANQVVVDLRVLGFSLLTTVAALGMFGILPAFQATRANTADTLKESGRHSASGAQLLFRRALVSGEIALAVLISAGAGLMLSSVREMGSVNTGIDASGRLLATIALRSAVYRDPEQAISFFTTLLDRLNSDPRVVSATAASDIPYNGNPGDGPLEIEGHAEKFIHGARISGHTVFVHEGFFETMGIPLIEGRLFERNDVQDSEPVTVISQTMAEAFWPGEDPIGQRLGITGHMSTIVGIVGDVHWNGIREDPRPANYLRLVQTPPLSWATRLQTSLQVAIQVNVDPVTFVPTLRAMVTELDAGIPLRGWETIEDAVAQQTARDRFFLLLMGLFAAIAVILGTVGIYGVMSYTVAQRSKEIGIRMALGAESHRMAGSMVWQSFVLTGIGVGIGLLGAVAGGRVLQSMLFNVTPRDPTTLLSVAGLFVLVGAASAVAPAVRAARMDPVEVLRTE